MTDIAKLGIAVDTKDLNAAIRTLASFQEESKKTGKATSELEKSLRTAATAVGGFFAARKIFNDFRESIGYMDDMADSADRIGISSEAFSKLAYAAKQTEVDIGTLEVSLKQMLLALSEAKSDPNSGAAGVFKDLRLNIEELNALGPDEALLRIADALNKVGSSADRAKLQQEIFGRGAFQLRDIMKLGSEEIRKFYTEAERLGIVIDKEMADKAEKAKQAFERLDSSYQGLMVSFADSGAIDTLAAGLNRLAGAITDISKYFREARAEKLAFEGVVAQFKDEDMGNSYRKATDDIENYGDQLVDVNERIRNLQNNMKNAESKRGDFWAGNVDISIKQMADQLDANLKFRQELVNKLGKAQEKQSELYRTLDIKPVQAAPVEEEKSGGYTYTGGGDKAGQKEAEDALKRAEMYYDNTRTAAEAYKITEAELDKLLAQKTITQETYNRALKVARDQYAEDAGARQIFEETRTAAENYAIELEKLNGLLEEGLITQDTYNRAVSNAQDSYIQAQNESNKFFNALDTIGEAALNGQIRDLNDLAEVASATFAKILIEYIKSRAQIAALESSGGGFLGFLGNLAGGIFDFGVDPSAAIAQANARGAANPDLYGPGFAEGGSFRVGGVGGVDSKRVSFMASPDEVVSISRNGPGSGGSGEAPKTEVHIYTPAGMKAETKESQNETGGKTIEVFIDEVTAQALSNPASKSSKALRRTYGATPVLNQR